MARETPAGRPLVDLNAFERDVLTAAAALRDANGLRILEELEPFHDGEIFHGRFYPRLNALVEKGYVDKVPADGREFKFILSEKGRSAFLQDLAFREYGAGFHEGGRQETIEPELGAVSIEDLVNMIRRSDVDPLELFQELDVNARIQPFCPDCGRNLSTDPDAEHDCPANA